MVSRSFLTDDEALTIPEIKIVFILARFGPICSPGWFFIYKLTVNIDFTDQSAKCVVARCVGSHSRDDAFITLYNFSALLLLFIFQIGYSVILLIIGR